MKLDTIKLKKLVKQYYKITIPFLIILILFIFLNVKVMNYDSIIAFNLINNDLLERSINEENYIINHTLIFDESRLIKNIDDLFLMNKLDVNYEVIVNENKVTIKIKNMEKSYEISLNS